MEIEETETEISDDDEDDDDETSDEDSSDEDERLFSLINIGFIKFILKTTKH